MMPSTRGRLKSTALAGLLAGLGHLLLGACSPDIQVNGNLPEAETVAEIRAGVHDREQVSGLLGSPSVVSTFNDRQWYYIGQRSTQFAFLNPDLLERRILVVSFDANGVVNDTRSYTLEDGRVIDPVSRITPTEGRELTLIQQLFGNVGRFGSDTLQSQQRQRPTVP